MTTVMTGGLKKNNYGRNKHRKSTKMKTNTESGELDAHLSILPNSRWAPYIISVVTFSIRLFIVLDKGNMWILHPDEVFQSIEVAHSEVYGYGFRAYEYLPPPTLSSVADIQESSYGMYSMRSFLLPRIYMALFHLKNIFKIDTNPYMLAKLFHVMLSSCLPLSVYSFTLTLFRSSDSAFIASVLVAFSSHLTVLGTHTLINSLLSPLVFLGLATLIRHLQLKRKKPPAENFTEDINFNIQPNDHNTSDLQVENLDVKGRDVELVFSGFMLGIVCYVRVDLVLFVALAVFILGQPLHKDFLKKAKVLATFCGGFLAALIVGGLDDRWSYGRWFISPCQWFMFNVVKGYSGVLFGTSDWYYYINNIFFNDFCMKIATLFSIIWFFITAAIVVTGTSYLKIKLSNFIATVKLVILLIFLFFFYTLKGHKEVRFLHNFIVTFFVLLSAQLTHAMFFLKESNVKSIISSKWLTYSLLAAYCAYNQAGLPSPRNASNEKWVFGGIWDSNHINECLDYVGSTDDVSGVFLDRSIHMTAAYSLLHRDVPWFSLIHYEFNEFDKNSRVNLPSVDFTSYKYNVSVSVLSRISQYITTENAPLVLKHLIDNPQYNYLVLTRKRKVINVGFEEVFSSGTMKVLKRSTDPVINEQLSNIANNIPLGNNATILEYEGSWLKTLGLTNLAIERLKYAIKLDPNRIRAFQLLRLSYVDIADTESAASVYKVCVQLHGSRECNALKPRVILHKDYDIL